MTASRLVAVLALLAACGPSSSPSPSVDGGAPDMALAPGWHVLGGHLRAPDGRAVILRGANVTGAQKSPPYIDAHTSEADYASLRSTWSMNSLRFLLVWAAVEPQPGAYDDAYLDQVVERMRWASKEGLLVVLDMHQDVYGEGFGFDGAPKWTCDQHYYDAFKPNPGFWALSYLDPNVQACVDHFYVDADTRARFVAAWRHVAARLKNEPAILGFDILNEPHWGSYAINDFEHDRLQPLEEEVIAAVRAEAPGWLAFAEPSSARNLGFSSNLAPFAAADVVYAPHEYDSMAEASGTFDAAGRDAILANVHRLRAEADALGAALWIGEYGGIADSPAIGDYMAAVQDAAGSVAASAAYWDDSTGGGYSMRDANGNPKASLLDAIVRPYPEFTAGTPTGWSFDRATGTFQLDWKPDAAVAAPTEIVLPARIYGPTATVECGGCEWRRDGERLVVTKAPAGDSATITVRK
jgi:endoglycosylceramidase